MSDRRSPPVDPLGPYGPAYGQSRASIQNHPVDLSTDPDVQKTAAEVSAAVRDGREAVQDLVDSAGKGLRHLHEGACALEDVPGQIQGVQKGLKGAVQDMGEGFDSAKRAVSAAGQFVSDAGTLLTGAGRLLDSFKPAADPESSPKPSLVAESAPQPPSPKQGGMAP